MTRNGMKWHEYWGNRTRMAQIGQRSWNTDGTDWTRIVAVTVEGTLIALLRHFSIWVNQCPIRVLCVLLIFSLSVQIRVQSVRSVFNYSFHYPCKSVSNPCNQCSITLFIIHVNPCPIRMIRVPFANLYPNSIQLFTFTSNAQGSIPINPHTV